VARMSTKPSEDWSSRSANSSAVGAGVVMTPA
jgi:hypothetical protein